MFKDYLKEFTKLQTPKIKEVGEFLLKGENYKKYIKDTINKFSPSEIEIDSGLNLKTIKRFTSGFYSYLEEKSKE